jgi:hypothetical protein
VHNSQQAELAKVELLISKVQIIGVWRAFSTKGFIKSIFLLPKICTSHFFLLPLQP